MASDFERSLRDALAGYRPARVKVRGARDAAVLIPVLEQPEPAILFTVRTDTVRSHKGQISFPGGSIDAGDPSAEAAALREAHEEVGLEPSAVDVLGELDTTPTFVSGFVISPFVGLLRGRPQLRPNPAEVAEVLEVPLADLNDEIRAEPGFAHAGRTYPTEAWIWRDYVIWGVTARLIRLFLGVLAASGLVPAPSETKSWTATGRLGERPGTGWPA
ncbi:MAG TPA: CoA pyrophosphatase [Actinomycetota bacterium]|nr:CoA pyrophosphatase [Actinomycetota bacterium]